ncbi:MAG: lysophospholipid acyltransferase family protein [Planctomycetota bacterium]|nr:lysophospholipid acyltransferase family protein [Planctomycetota bacterium]
MKLEAPWMMRLGGFGITCAMRSWMSTMDYRIHREEPAADPVLAEYQGPNIYLFWHEYIPIPFYLRGRCNITMLLSRHRDAEWLSHTARYMGFGTVRASTSRGGVAGLKELLNVGKTQNLTMTPDGPRGPRRRLAQGCIYLSSRLQIPLVCLGFGCDRPWRVKRAWDQFAIPRPGSRIRMMIGRRIQIPEGLGRDEIEQQRLKVEQILQTRTLCAEQWAASGSRMIDEQPLRKEPAPLYYDMPRTTF